MDSALTPEETALTASIQDLHISEVHHEPNLSQDPPIAEANPWKEDGLGKDIASHPTTSVVDTTGLDLSAAAAGLSEAEAESDEHEIQVSEEVLNEFDPLAGDQREKAAQEAWVNSESHPPPPPPPAPTHDQAQPASPRSYIPNTSASNSPPNSPSAGGFPASFTSLAALARTFALPLPRTRPQSLDMAVAVPSPSTLSSFATQQQQKRLQPERLDSGLQTVDDSGASSSASALNDSPSNNGKERDKDPPFDFQRFLDQMKMKGAEPVAKFLRSFLSNFAKRTFTVNDQVKLIHDFLDFISLRMRESDVWRNASDAEFDNAMEGMEKLVMNRLYDFTFTPAVVRMVPVRPVTADDLERDRVLSQRIALFGWIEGKHLDVPEGEGSKGFLMFAEQELLKINHYKAPRDKLICVLNCCKVIFGLLRHLRTQEGADSFLPILIYVVLKANPEHLLSNVEFINRFRSPAKLQSEAGYYLSSLMGAVSFIETMDHTSLSNITQEEFERNVEEAIQSLPQSNPASPEVTDPPSTPNRISEKGTSFGGNLMSPRTGEEAAQPLSLPVPGTSLSEDARRLIQKTGDTISKPLSAISRIFNEALDNADGKLGYLPGPFAPFELGRENRQAQALQEQDGQPPVPHWSHPVTGQEYTPQTPGGEGSQQYGAALQTPYKPRVRRIPSPLSAQSTGSQSQMFSPEGTPTRGAHAPYTNQPLSLGPSQSLPALYPQSPRMQALMSQSESEGHVSRTPTPNLDIAGIQAEIDQAHERAASAATETLIQIFPSTDREVIDWVLEANGGDLGRSIEALLEMSSGT